MGGVSASLRGHHARPVPSGLRHAAGARFSRRRIRISLGRGDEQGLLERCLRRRLDDCRHLSGRDPRRHHPRHQSGERRLRRRTIRLGNPLRLAVRPGGDGGLRPARRHLAGDEDGRRGRRARARSGHGGARGRACVHGGGQSLDTARVRPHRGALVLGPQHLLLVAGTFAYGADRADGLALARGAAARYFPFSHRSCCSCSAISVS